MYPWNFTPRHIAGNPVEILLHAWHPAYSRWFFRDIVVNVCLYIPLGFAAYMVFRGSRMPLLRFYGPVLLGLVLSASMELAQLYTPSRDTSLIDLITNVIGSAAGVAVAVLFEKMAGPIPRRSRPFRVDRAALMLVFCWLAWLLFPFFPVLGMFVLIRKVAAFVAAPLFVPLPVLSAAAIWFAAGLLLASAGIRLVKPLLGLSVLAVPAQLLIVERQPVPSDLLGAIAGFFLFALRPEAKPITKTEAWAFLAVVAIRGFSPFRFAAAAAPFTWIPFAALLNSEWQFATLTLLGKILYYTTAVWLLRKTGMQLWLATAIVAALLALIEATQTHLPGRTPEIMDPLLALLMGFVLFILFRETGTRFRSAE